jgi:hypothetical protein
VSQDSLAVDFFLMVHDPFDDGKLSISTELLGCGLVGAELADLMLARRLGVEDERLVVLNPGGQLDEVDDYVIKAIGSQASAHTIRSWVEPLQDGVYALIGRTLVTSGVVRRQPGGRRIRGGHHPDRFPSNDLLATSRPQQRLERLLRAPKDLTLRVGFFAALIGVIGLEGTLNPELDRPALRELLAEIEQHLPADLQAVCDGVRAVTSEVSLRAK